MVQLFGQAFLVVIGLLGGHVEDFQTFTTHEGPPINRCHRVGDGDAGQSSATIEGDVSTILVTESGMAMLISPVQSSKAHSSISSTDSGMVTGVKPLQPSNAYSPISVTELGITVFWHPAFNVVLAGLSLFVMSSF